MSLIRAIPEQGQIVNVRSRRFVVTGVQKSSLPTNPLLNGIKEPQHLVTLSSLEDDALGEELHLMRAAHKVNHIREDLGKVGPVIAQQVEEA